MINTLGEEALMDRDVDKLQCNPVRTMSCLGKGRDEVIKIGRTESDKRTSKTSGRVSMIELTYAAGACKADSLIS